MSVSSNISYSLGSDCEAVVGMYRLMGQRQVGAEVGDHPSQPRAIGMFGRETIEFPDEVGEGALPGSRTER
jgi:hypothetical protein